MSIEQDQAREIAERIARRVSAESPSSMRPAQTGEVSSELAAVRAGLSELQRKIAQLEAKVTSGATDRASSPGISNAASTGSSSPHPVPSTHSPWLAGVNA